MPWSMNFSDVDSLSMSGYPARRILERMRSCSLMYVSRLSPMLNVMERVVSSRREWSMVVSSVTMFWTCCKRRCGWSLRDAESRREMMSLGRLARIRRERRSWLRLKAVNSVGSVGAVVAGLRWISRLRSEASTSRVRCQYSKCSMSRGGR